MTARHVDGSAGDANYGRIGEGYARYRQPEPAIASLNAQALGDAASLRWLAQAGHRAGVSALPQAERTSSR